MAFDPVEGMSAASLEKFRVLQQHFVAGLAARMAAMAGAASPPELAAELHKLAGAAAAFGFGRMGECAKAAEQLVLNPSVGGDAGGDREAALALVEAEINHARMLLEKDIRQAQ